MSKQDDFSSLFAPEAAKAEGGADVWKVLMVDDEPDIHAVIRLALQDVVIEGRPLQLLDAKSGEETKARLNEHPDIALILLDVVMETERAGLDLVRYIRKELNNRTIQIVLVTGQPGYAPQREVIQDFEIDGYRLKSELSADKLFVTVYAALRTHNALLELKNEHELLESKTTELDLFFTSALDLFCIANTDGYFLKLNSEWENTLGYPIEELMGRKFLDLIHPDDLEGTLGAISELSDQNPVLSFSNRYRHKDGSYRWLEWRSFPRGDKIYAAARNVTEKKRLEAQLRDERDFAENVLKTAPSIIVVLDKQGCVERINPYMEEISGYTLAEVKGKDWFTTFLPKANQEKTKALFLQSINDISVHGNIDTIIIRSGEERSIEWYDKTIKDNEGNSLGLLAIGQDVTEREKSDEELREANRRFKGMTEASPLAIYMSTAGVEQVGEYINPAFIKLFGYTLEDVPTVAEWWPRAYPDEAYRKQITSDWKEKIAKAIEEKSDIEPIEAVVTCKDGSEKIISWGFISTDQVDCSFGLDLTDVRKANEVLRQSERRLAEAQRLAHLGNWRLDLVNDKLEWSDEVFRIFEVDKDHFQASYGNFLEFIHPDDREEVDHAYTESVKNMQPYEITHRLLMKDGRIKYVIEHSETHYDAMNKPLYSIGTIHDITEIKQAEEQLNELNRNLERRVEERTKELFETNRRLEGFNEMLADREMRVIEIKQEVNRLRRELGQEPIYGETEAVLKKNEEDKR